MAKHSQHQALERIQHILDTSIAAGIPSVTAAIRTPSGQEYNFHAGYQDITSQTPIDRSCVFGIGRITKLLIAVVIFQLIGEGKLKLDNLAFSIIADSFAERIPHAETATTGDLPSHSGGIASWEDDPDWIRDGRGDRVGLGKMWQKNETLKYVHADASAALTKGEFSYANTNYTLLGLITDKIIGGTAEGEVRRRILEPLGMRETYMEGFERAPEGVSVPHRYYWAMTTFRETAGLSPHFPLVREDLLEAKGYNLSVSWAAGGMLPSVSDLLEFAAALRSGRLLSTASMEKLMEWHPASSI